MKPFAITLDAGSSRTNHTGAWRVQRPRYVERTAPCDHACPSGEHPQAWLARAEEGDYHAAWTAVVAHNPLPAVMGRACYHPCEGTCNRGKLDEAVSIHAVERFLGTSRSASDGFSPRRERRRASGSSSSAADRAGSRRPTTSPSQGTT